MTKFENDTLDALLRMKAKELETGNDKEKELAKSISDICSTLLVIEVIKES